MLPYSVRTYPEQTLFSNTFSSPWAENLCLLLPSLFYDGSPPVTGLVLYSSHQIQVQIHNNGTTASYIIVELVVELISSPLAHGFAH